ncbi:hypothetical protein GCM10022393_00860 [Aquimarina addita]|uniref:Uncharacterized protein n=2 Tax=Aquimarina addita TaxID=870485 RepID=A0ABP7X7L9_9FLAO
MQTGCYSYKWNDTRSQKNTSSPEIIRSFFDQFPDKIMRIKAISPSDSYRYDAWEKDEVFAKDSLAIHFDIVELKLKDMMPEGTIMVDFTFQDGKGNKVMVPDFDLLRLVPSFDAQGEHCYPELLMEEFNRYGVSLRKEFDEFKIVKGKSSSDKYKEALDRVHRASITNGCLSAGKWEFNLNSEDFSDFSKRLHSAVNYNQSKIFAHTWFLLDTSFYQNLVKFKNPDLDVKGFDVAGFDYNKLSKKSEEVIIDFNTLRNPIKKIWNTKMLEVGHQSERQIELLDMEEHYKIEYGLFLNQDPLSLSRETYKSILDPKKQPIHLAQFRDEGFYSPSTALSFDMNWLQYLDTISVSAVDVATTDCLSEIQITGKWAPFAITITNIDLAQIQEQKLYGLHFGFNVYPKGRRYNPAQPTISFDTDLMPREYEQSVLMTDTKTGKWVDNFKKGLSKVYITCPTLEKDVLDIYLISYERIVPLWMGRVKLPKQLREKVRIRNQMYNY